MLSYLARRHKRPELDADLPPALLLDDLAGFAPDSVAVTGDLTCLAMPAEFAAAAAFLRRIGPPERVAVVPGNHDALVPVPWAEGVGQWAEWMHGDSPDPAFPFVRRHGHVALIGLSTAVPTPPGSAAGRLGGGQIERLASLLALLRNEGRCRVVLIHHPPSGEGRRRAMRDRAALLAVLAREGTEMLLHGHSHRPALTGLPGPDGRLLPVIGVPPALAGTGRRHRARWHLYRIARTTEGWSLNTLVRGYDPAAGSFRTLGAWHLDIGRAGPDGGAARS